MDIILHFNPITRFLSTLTILLLFLCSGLYFNRARKIEGGKEERFLLLSFTIILLGQGLSGIALFISDYYLVGYYDGHSYYIIYQETKSFHSILLFMSYFISFISFTISFLFMEKALNSKYFVVTLISLGITILLLFLPYDLFSKINYILVIPIVMGFFFLLGRLIKDSTDELKPIPLFITLGFIILTVGTILSSGAMTKTIERTTTFPSLYLIAGIIICTSPLYMGSWIIEKKHIIMLTSIVSIILSLSFILTIFLNSAVLTDIRLIAIFIVFFIGTLAVLAFFTIHAFQLSSNTLSNENTFMNEKHKEFLKIFTKPKLISEQDVLFHREQKICIVCKNKISRLVFICLECDVLYCINCSEIITEIENSCWVCGVEMDESLPKIEYEPPSEIENKKKKLPKNIEQ